MTALLGQSRGFTLLELLVAMTVLALMTALLFGGLQFGARVWRTGDGETERFQRLDAAFQLMQRSLTAASPALMAEVPEGGPRGVRPAGMPRPQTVDFTGFPDAVSFVGPAPAQILGGGLYRLTFALVEGEGGRRLMFALQPREGEAQSAAAMTWVLIDGIARGRFAYFGRVDGGANATWVDRWTEQGTLPLLVSLQIEFFPGDRRVWPQLLVAPLLSTPLQ